MRGVAVTVFVHQRELPHVSSSNLDYSEISSSRRRMWLFHPAGTHKRSLCWKRSLNSDLLSTMFIFRGYSFLQCTLSEMPGMPVITVHLNAPRIGVILRRLHLKIKAFASVLLLDEDMPVDYSDFWDGNITKPPPR